MTGFALAAALLVSIALAALLWPLLRARPRAGSDAQRAAANAAIYREQLEELEADLARGALTAEEHEKAKRDIQHRIVGEYGVEAAPAATSRAPWPAIAAVALLVPLVAGLGYWKLGNPAGLDPEKVAGGPQISPEQMTALVEQLWQRMQKETPEDPEGWVLLGRSLTVMGDYPRAATSFQNAVRLVPGNADLLADYADALAMAQGRKLEGEPLAVLKKALAIDPGHVKALALAGTAEFEKKNYPAAVAHWERLLQAAPPGSEFAQSVQGSIAEARQLGGLGPGKPAPQKAAAAAAVEGVVSLDPSLAGKAAPGDTVFVIARAANGPRIPLAVARTTVARLPYRFRLDDSMAMAPGMTLSSQPQVVVAARISKSGQATPAKGDIEGTSAAVAPGASGIKVVLSRVVD